MGDETTNLILSINSHSHKKIEEAPLMWKCSDYTPPSLLGFQTPPYKSSHHRDFSTVWTHKPQTTIVIHAATSILHTAPSYNSCIHSIFHKKTKLDTHSTSTPSMNHIEITSYPPRAQHDDATSLILRRCHSATHNLTTMWKYQFIFSVSSVTVISQFVLLLLFCLLEYASIIWFASYVLCCC